jgi:hypothetical protein
MSTLNTTFRHQPEDYGQIFFFSLFSLLLINPLNAELNPTCHLLISLGDLTFMGKCIVSISNKMQRYTVFLYLETALHVSGGTFTHHQKRIQLYLQHLVFVTPLLLSDAIVEELEPVWVCCGWRTPPTAKCLIYISSLRVWGFYLYTIEMPQYRQTQCPYTVDK